MKFGWKWYKFRVYFAPVSIALYAFLALIFAVQIMQTPSAVVLVLLNLAACAIYGLFFCTLREYKRYILIVLVAAAAFDVFFAVIFTNLVGDFGRAFPQLILRTATRLPLELIYFYKRKDYFAN